MGDPRFRMYLDDRPATRAQLDEIDEIQVDQVVDVAWQATLQIAICTDDKGAWCYPGDAFRATFGRLRLELDPGDGSFVPLIDGPIVGRRQAMSFQPGQSVETIVVQDDSVLLNREDRARQVERGSDGDVAQTLFRRGSHIDRVDVDSDTASGTDGEVVRFQRETDMQYLRRLARHQGMHAYVLPGERPGRSVGVFRPFPTRTDGLPPLILVGPDRNLESFNPREDAQSPATVKASTLSLIDKSVTNASASFRDVQSLGSAPAGAAVRDGATRILPGGADGAIDARRMVRSWAERFSYSFRVDGRVATGCYRAVLSPYRLVTVKGVGEELGGDYRIERVRHHISRSAWTQEFRLSRNARSTGAAGASLPVPF